MKIYNWLNTLKPVMWIVIASTVLLLCACNPRTTLNNENLLNGARAETFSLNHGALCARLPAVEAIDAYSRDLLPPNSAIARDVRAWDLSGLLDILKTEDGRWIVLPSSGLKKLKGVHFKKGATGDNDALCFGRLQVERTIDFTQNTSLGIPDAVTGRFLASLQDAPILKHFKNLKIESFDPSLFVLSDGIAYGSILQPNFVIEMALRPTQSGWFLARPNRVAEKPK